MDTTRRSETISLPAGEELLSSNRRYHWRTRHRVTKALRATAAWTAKAQGVAPFTTPVRITAVIHPKTNRRFDPHNLQPSVKALIDGLVDARLIPDDDSEHLAEVAFVAGEKNPAGWQIVLRVEEATR